MTAGALCSDHVNYLIFRYLQEAGHENAATAFHRDWHRPHEYRDPENYPWAQNVHRSELVSVIQSGLHHDELQARVRKGTRRFQFTLTSSRESAESRDGAPTENGAAGSRPSSSAKRKSRPHVPRQADEFPTPAPKRQRRIEGSEGVHLNGERDAMDVDAPSPSAEADEDADAASPTIGSEPEMTDVHERYDSMDVAVQTEPKTGPKTSTIHWKIDKPDATILHSVFNPSTAPNHARTLMTVGASLCRFYEIPENVSEGQQISSIEEPEIPASSVVTASAWHPDGHTATCAIDTVREIQDDRQEPQQMLLNYDSRTGVSDYLNPPLLEPPGLIWRIRYNLTGQRLLVLRMNLEQSLVLVYDVSNQHTNGQTLEAWCSIKQPAFDIAWLSSSDFIVCGGNGLSQGYTVAPFTSTTRDGLEITKVVDKSPIHGLRAIDGDVYSNDQILKWDKMCATERSPILALASSEGRRLVVGNLLTTSDDTGFTQMKAFFSKVDLPGNLVAMDMKTYISPNPQTADPAIIATAFEDGNCVLYSCFSTGDRVDNFEELVTLSVANGPALALTWSRNGKYLAIAGLDVVQVYDINLLVRQEGQILVKTGVQPEPLVTWRPVQNVFGPKNGEHEDATAMSEPSLSWSADGESLAFAIEKQIAIIRFRPPLGSITNGEEVNGLGSP